MSGPAVLFVVDAGPEVGGGHVMRSLTLARTLAERGASCAFTGSPAAQALLGTFSPETRWLGPLDRDRPAPSAFDALAFDHYGLAAPDHVRLAAGRPALAIDDLADRPLAADLVLDAGPERKTEDYAGLAPPGARLLLGPQYAPVRPEFAQLRRSALVRRSGPVRRVLLAMGLTDVGGITGRLLRRLRPLADGVSFDVVLGAAAPSLAALQALAAREASVRLHVETQDMARLTAETDIAVGAPGSSSWERCVLALPSLLVVLAQNQRPAARALADKGAALVVDKASPDFDAEVTSAFQRLVDDEDLRRRLSSVSAGVCDGLGAARAADAFLEVIAARAA